MTDRLTIFLVLLWLPLTVSAEGSATFISHIAGIEIWQPFLEIGEKFPHEDFESPGPDNEFIAYCDGNNSVYILELPGDGVKCKTSEVSPSWYKIELLSTDKRLLGKITISKNYPLKVWAVVDKINTSDQEEIQIILNERVKSLADKNQETMQTTSEDNHAWLQEMKKDIVFVNHQYQEVVRANGKEFYIVTVGPELQALGWDMWNMIIEKRDGEFYFLGDIFGCIDGLADIDDDGFPEISADLCENNEGFSSEYWKIFPEIMSVVVRSQ